MTSSRNTIFISYRRADAGGYARLLYDRLDQRFKGRVFMDTSGIEPGVDFVEGIEQALRHCGVLVVLIGPQWAASTDSRGKARLDDPEDIVRQELEAGLARAEVHILPVLLAGAKMPAAALLPPSLAPLTRRQAIDLRDATLDQDTARLASTIDQVLASSAVAPSRSARARWLVGVLAAAAIAVSVIVVQSLPTVDRPEPPRPGPAEPVEAFGFDGPGTWRIAYSGRATGELIIQLDDDRTYTLPDVAGAAPREGEGKESKDMESAIGDLVDAFGGLASAAAGSVDALRSVLGRSGTWTYDRRSRRLTLLPSAGHAGLGIVLTERLADGFRGTDGAGIAFELEPVE